MNPKHSESYECLPSSGDLAVCIKMFECMLEGIFLKRLFEALKDICSDISIECNENGISMQAMDTSHISLIHLVIHTEFFQHYRCDSPCTLGLNIPFMLKVLAVVKEKSVVYLSKGEIDQDDPILSIRIIETDVPNLALETENETLEIQVKMVDIEKERLEIPDCDYASKCTLNSKKFQEFAKYLNSIGDTVTVSMQKGTMTLEAEGEGIKATKNFVSEIGEVRITCNEPVSQIFATRYLVLFSKATLLAQEVSIMLSPGIPLSVKFDFCDKPNQASTDSTSQSGSGGSAYINFYLAPNIEE